MREHNYAFCRLAVEHFGCSGPVFEFGSFQVAGQQHIADLRGLFSDQKYIGCDIRPGPGVDRILDVTQTRLPDHAAGAVFAIETLEHVLEVQKAFQEMYRILRPGGMIVLTCPFHFAIHDYPDDFWRITPSCLRRMLSPYAGRIVGYQGPALTPHTVMGLAIKAPAPADFAARAMRMSRAYEQWLKHQEQAIPFQSRLRRWIRKAYRSKGERRWLTEYYRTQMVIDVAAATLAKVG